MTTNNLNLIAARADAASPGPWTVAGGEQDLETGTWAPTEVMGPRWPNDEDSEFIAHARQDVPALVDEVRELRELVAAIRSTGGLPIDEWWQAIRQLIRDRDAQEAVDLVAATTGPGSEPCS